MRFRYAIAAMSAQIRGENKTGEVYLAKARSLVGSVVNDFSPDAGIYFVGLLMTYPLRGQ